MQIKGLTGFDNAFKSKQQQQKKFIKKPKKFIKKKKIAQ